MIPIRTFALTAALLIGLVIPVRSAAACSCLERPLPDQVAKAATVFLGTVSAADQNATTFEVSRVFKGEGPGRAPVSNGGPGTDCAIPFVEGRRYVVFAALQNNVLSTDLCSGTTTDLSVVGRLAVASSPTPGAAPTRKVIAASSRAVPIAAATIILGFLVIASLLALRAGRRPRPLAYGARTSSVADTFCTPVSPTARALPAERSRIRPST
jgi:hypothetical protein